MADSADLEISVQRGEGGEYAVKLVYSPPQSEAEVVAGQGQADFDLDELGQLLIQPEEYGRRLGQALFADASLLAGFGAAQAAAASAGVPLRVRLRIEPGADELHALRWETLRSPQDDAPLLFGENLLFSRFLISRDWKTVTLRPRSAMRALAIVANPHNLADYSLAALDVPGEIEQARQALGAEIALDVLPAPEAQPRATLDALFARLRAAEYDIVYLVAHGSLVKGQPWLWLEDEHGQVQRAAGGEIEARFRELERRPRLVVLFSCDSAGTSGEEALAALGPRLAAAGVPAVLAMQGKVSLETASAFMKAFFAELQRDGRIDRAVSLARGAVRGRPDFWSPALFMRLRSGRIWYTPGFSESGGQRSADEFEKWQSLAGFVLEKTCTPIIGPGLSDGMLGARREIAMRWAEKQGFPFSPHERDVLPRVAQYVMTRHSPNYIPVAVRQALRDEIVRRYDDNLPEDLCQSANWSYPDLARALDVAIKNIYPPGRPDPYRQLADMRLPLYITCGHLGLMSRALIEAGVEPVVRICPWNKWIPTEKSLYEEIPTPERPLVYHLFGHLDTPNSLVYAEDRYFDYLIGITQNKSLIPSTVRAALNNSSLLFLGFQMDDWEFRVFFRFLMAQEGRELLKFYSHAAVQVEPEEDRIVDIRRARRYLEEYFQSENIGTYWGPSEKFLETLSRHLNGEGA